MLTIFINLLFLLFRKTLWRYKKFGILIVHFGALLLFFGGGITAYFSYEGQMTIKEGESSNYIEDYYIKELAILPSNHPPIIFNQEQLVELDNHELSYNNINFSFPGLDAETLIIKMKGIACSTGSACSTANLEPSHVIKAIGRDSEIAHSAIRFSLGRFTTKDEIHFAIQEINRTVSELKNRSRGY